MIHAVVFSSILAAVCGYALWRGGAPERMVAMFFGTAAIATLMLPFRYETSFHTVERGGLLIDFVLWLTLVMVALAANRFWPIWVAAIQLVAVAIHGVKAYDPTLAAWLYNSATGKIGYVMVIMLAVGVYRHHGRMAAYGADPDWTLRHHEAVDL